MRPEHAQALRAQGFLPFASDVLNEFLMNPGLEQIVLRCRVEGTAASEPEEGFPVTDVISGFLREMDIHVSGCEIAKWADAELVSSYLWSNLPTQLMGGGELVLTRGTPAIKRFVGAHPGALDPSPEIEETLRSPEYTGCVQELAAELDAAFGSVSHDYDEIRICGQAKPVMVGVAKLEFLYNAEVERLALTAESAGFVLDGGIPAEYRFDFLREIGSLFWNGLRQPCAATAAVELMADGLWTAQFVSLGHRKKGARYGSPVLRDAALPRGYKRRNGFASVAAALVAVNEMIELQKAELPPEHEFESN